MILLVLSWYWWMVVVMEVALIESKARPSLVLG